MGPLSLDFLHDRRPVTAIGATLLLLGTLAAAALIYAHSLMNAETVALQRELSALRGSGSESALERYAAAHLAGKDIFAEVRRANRVIAHLSLPWDELFAALEGAEDYQVALLNIEPDVQKHGLVIAGEAKTLEDMLEFVRYLQGEACLSDVILQTHKVNLQDKEKPVRFRVAATWVIAS